MANIGVSLIWIKYAGVCRLANLKGELEGPRKPDILQAMTYHSDHVMTISDVMKWQHTMDAAGVNA